MRWTYVLFFLITHFNPVVSHSVDQHLFSAFVTPRFKKKWVRRLVFRKHFCCFSRGTQYLFYWRNTFKLYFLHRGELNMMVCWEHFAMFLKKKIYKPAKMFYRYFFPLETRVIMTFYVVIIISPIVYNMVCKRGGNWSYRYIFPNFSIWLRNRPERSEIIDFLF